MARRADILGRLPIVFGLSEEEAAAAIGVSTTKFRDLVARKRMPRPRMADGRKVYDVDEVRASFKALPHEGEIADSRWSDVAA